MNFTKIGGHRFNQDIGHHLPGKHMGGKKDRFNAQRRPAL
jgi:hypothetical protein